MTSVVEHRLGPSMPTYEAIRLWDGLVRLRGYQGANLFDSKNLSDCFLQLSETGGKSILLGAPGEGVLDCRCPPRQLAKYGRWIESD